MAKKKKLGVGMKLAIRLMNVMAKVRFDEDKRKIPKPADYVRSLEKNAEHVNIGDYNEYGMRIYGANVGLMRAIPDIMDGFKPLERRILYGTAFLAKAVKVKKKNLAIGGHIISIHPHGDSSIHESMVAMAQPWENLYPLFDIKGNKGQPNGEPEAAPRYLQSCLTDYCFDCFFKDWDDHIVEMSPSYNPEFMEPDYLITKYPNLLVRPITGFAFATSTSFPSFNMEESFNAVIKLIKDPSYDPILYPDLPSGCIIVDGGEFPDICHTGEGTFKMKAEVELNEETHSIIIYSLPYHVTTSKIIEVVTKLKATGDIPGLAGIHDASNKYGVKLIIKCSHDVNMRDILHMLYKKTPLMDTFACKFRFVDNYELKLYNLKQIMQKWIDIRRVTKHKWATYKLVTLKESIHILNVLIDITSSEEKSLTMIKKIRNSRTEEIIQHLCETYKGITTLQAKTIADLRARKFSIDSQENYKKEKEENLAEIEHLEELISHPKNIDKMIIDELKECISKYALPRRCRIEKAVSEDDMIPNRDFVLVFTRKGLVKKLDTNAKGIGKLNDGDDPVQVIKINNRDSVVIFDRSGLVHTVKVSDIIQTDLKSKGTQLSKYAGIRGGTVMALPLSQIDTDKGQFIFITEKGMIKKTSCSKYGFKSSIIAIVLKGDDGLASVIYNTKDSADIIVFTKNGIGNRFTTDTFTETSRMSSGVIAIDIPQDDQVVGVATVGEKDKGYVVLTEKGVGKYCSLDTFEPKKRRSDALKLISLGGDRVVDLLPCKKGDQFMVVLKKDTLVLRWNDFPELTRNHYGKKLVPVPNGEQIIRFFKLTDL
jgi:DNA gyrase subunit A